MRDNGCFLGKVVSSFEVPSEEPDSSTDVARQQQLAALVGEFAMNANRGRPGNRGYVPRHFAALFESTDRAMKDDEIRSVGGISIAFAIDVLKAALLLQFLHQVFIKRDLKFSG